MQNVDMVGCRRRRAYAFQESLGRRVDFRCIGQNIPCTVRIGDTVNFTATFETGKKVPIRLNIKVLLLISKVIMLNQSIYKSQLKEFFSFSIKRFGAKSNLAPRMGQYSMGRA